MNKPIRPIPPWESEYKATIERKYIYWYKEDLRGDDDDYEEEEQELSAKQKELAKLPQKPINKVDISWLISLLPEGITPDKVKIDFGYNFNCMAYEDHYIGFYYEVKVPSRMKQYKVDLTKYEQDNAQYERDLAAYAEWERQEEIKITKKTRIAFLGFSGFAVL